MKARTPITRAAIETPRKRAPKVTTEEGETITRQLFTGRVTPATKEAITRLAKLFNTSEGDVIDRAITMLDKNAKMLRKLELKKQSEALDQ